MAKRPSLSATIDYRRRLPRTLTGRVACRMVDALEAAHVGISLHSDFEFGLMLGAAQMTLQGLTPEDCDNDKGVDAMVAIFSMLTKEHDRGTIYVTPAWRRVVLSARRRTTRRDGERHWKWKASGEATAIRAVRIPW